MTSSKNHHCIDFVHELTWQSLPVDVQNMARRCLLDLVGVAASGTQTQLSRTINSHAVEHFAAGPTMNGAKNGAINGARLLFDGRRVSPAGAAMANGMTIDSVDAHDGYKPAKGHAGCGVLAAALAVFDNESSKVSANVQAKKADEQEFLTSLVIGYELACRAGVSLHASTPDYHTSGAWVALAAAAVGARVMRLNSAETEHALGIAEYHGPRSQMMRCIDYPTMVKDGSGWGAMAGVSAAYLARSGFTGAPAVSMLSDAAATHFEDLGKRWLVCEQYFKPYPVCRWAQPAIVAALKLQSEQNFKASDIAELEIHTFHESARLAVSTPLDTEQAQYSLPFPVSAALHNQGLTAEHIDGDALINTDVLSLSRAIKLFERDEYNAVFPQRRISDVRIILQDGSVYESGPTEADGDPESALSDEEIVGKFHRFAAPVLGDVKAQSLETCINQMGKEAQPLDALYSHLYLC